MVKLRLVTLLALLLVGLFPLNRLALAQTTSAEVFATVLTEAEEVPPTGGPAVGHASYLVSQAGTRVYFALLATGATSPFVGGHIHLGPPAENGPIVVHLCGSGGRPPCGTEGVIGQGTFTQADLTGPLEGATLEDLLAEMRAGNTYTNFHTQMFPGGEIRGQNARVGP